MSNNFTEKVTMRFDEKTWNQIKERALKRNVSTATILRLAVQSFFSIESQHEASQELAMQVVESVSKTNIKAEEKISEMNLKLAKLIDLFIEKRSD